MSHVAERPEYIITSKNLAEKMRAERKNTLARGESGVERRDEDTSGTCLNGVEKER